MTAAVNDDTARERVIFFSDAVFAIAITLLAIDLRLPATELVTSDEALLQALRDLLPRFAAYGLSFFVIGSAWVGHWRRYQAVRRINDQLLLLNLLLLGVVAAIPFPTSLIGEHGDRPLAVVIYAISVSLTGALGALSWLYATWAGLTDESAQHASHRAALRSLTVSGVMLVSLPALCWVTPYIVETSWLLILPAQFVVMRLMRAGG